MLHPAAIAIATLILCLAAALAWIWGANWLLDRILPPRGTAISRNIRRAALIRPWLFLGPALLFLSAFLIYPALGTIWLSFHGPDGKAFTGLANHAWLWRDGAVRQAALNTGLWLLVVPAAATALGLVGAALTDTLRWGGLARILIFLPVAVSGAAAAVIWKFVLDFRPLGAPQTGLLNALVTWAGGTPQPWIAQPIVNTLFLMAIVVWTQTGFAMVILSAALRAVPGDTVEAARLDGATDLQVFLWIRVPQIRGPITAVWLAMTLVVLKVFDIVLALTNGQWNSNVLANLMFSWMFRGGGDFGRGAVLALALMALVLPILVATLQGGARTRKD